MRKRRSKNPIKINFPLCKKTVRRYDHNHVRQNRCKYSVINQREITMKKTMTTLSAAMLLGAASATVTAAENPFASQSLESGYQVAGHHAEKSAEGKCGEGKCGEGKCGAKADSEGKCGEGKCGGSK